MAQTAVPAAPTTVGSQTKEIGSPGPGSKTAVTGKDTPGSTTKVVTSAVGSQTSLLQFP